MVKKSKKEEQPNEQPEEELAAEKPEDPGAIPNPKQKEADTRKEGVKRRMVASDEDREKLKEKLMGDHEKHLGAAMPELRKPEVMEAIQSMRILLNELPREIRADAQGHENSYDDKVNELKELVKKL